jgi:hypothetical protein
LKYFNKILNPSCYQGNPKKLPHFEGWYYKLVDQNEQNIFAIIPGIYLSKNIIESHSFIQVFNGSEGKSYNLIYPVENFHSLQSKFDIKISLNHFTSKNILLDIKSNELTFIGELNFENLTPWPVTLLSPGIMGWYAWIPYMECFHGIVSLDHKIEGSLKVNDRKIIMDGGRGYIEKDWGRSFPEAYVWMQSNHFSQAGISFTGSTAIIPWIRKPFHGFIVGLWVDKILYRFATYTGAHITNFEITDNTINWVVKDKNYILEISAKRNNGSTLQAPNIAGMKRRIIESLSSEIALRLSQIKNGNHYLIFEDTGRNAGLEADGKLIKLLEMWRNKRHN